MSPIQNNLSGLALAASFFGVTADAHDLTPSDLPPEMPEPQSELLAKYETCAREALARIVPMAEALRCGDIYLRLKLSLLPEVTPEDYARLDAAGRARISRQGYAALTHWRAHQFDLALEH